MDLRSITPEFQRAVDIRRAVSLSGISGVMVQPEVDRLVANLANYKNALRQNVRRVRGSGEAYLINRRTPGTTAATFLGDTSTFTEDTGTYARVTFNYRTLGVQIRVTRMSQLATANYTDIFTEESEAKMEEFRDKEDHALFWGQRSGELTGNNSYDATNAFDGLFNLIASGNKMSLTTTSNGEASLTLAKMDQWLHLIRGQGADMIFCSQTGWRKLNALLQAQQRFIDKTEVRGGFQLMSYNGVPIYPCTNIPDTLQHNGTTLTALTGGTTTCMFAVDSSAFFVAELDPLHIEPLAKVSSQYDQYDMRESLVPVLRDTSKAAMLLGIGV